MARYKYGGMESRLPDYGHYKSISAAFHFRFIAEMPCRKGFGGKG